MADVTINGFNLGPGDSRGVGDGRVLYCICSVNYHNLKKVRFPSPRVMKRLAREYLGSDYWPYEGWTPRSFFFFYINPGTKRERRAAFLAAVMFNAVVSE